MLTETLAVGLGSFGIGVLSENHIRTYWWCNPARIGIATMAPDCWTARCKGASFCNAKAGWNFRKGQPW